MMKFKILNLNAYLQQVTCERICTLFTENYHINNLNNTCLLCTIFNIIYKTENMYTSVVEKKNKQQK